MNAQRSFIGSERRILRALLIMIGHGTRQEFPSNQWENNMSNQPLVQPVGVGLNYTASHWECLSDLIIVQGYWGRSVAEHWAPNRYEPGFKRFWREDRHHKLVTNPPTRHKKEKEEHQDSFSCHQFHPMTATIKIQPIDVYTGFVLWI